MTIFGNKIYLLFSLLFFSMHLNADPFHANHDVIFDGYTYHGLNDGSYLLIDVIKYSKNGNRIAFTGRYFPSSGPIQNKLFIIDFDGSNLKEIPLPALDIIAYDLAINDDGSILYAITPWYQEKIYRINITQNPVTANLTEIADLGVLQIGGVLDSNIQTTATGDWVYYINSNNLNNGGRDDMYRISSTGAAFETVIQDVAIPISNTSGCIGVGDNVFRDKFSITSTGSNVLFQLYGINYGNCNNVNGFYGWVTSPNLGFPVLSPETSIGHTGGVISGDGSTIVIAYTNNDKYKVYNPDGTGGLEIEPRGNNFTGSSITYDGSKMFFGDSLNRTGRITNTDGSNGVQILPKNTFETLELNHVGGINNGGNLVAYSDTLHRIYAGKINPTNSENSQAPVISDITFDPPYIFEGSIEDVKIYVTTHAVVGDIEVVKIDNMIDSRYSTLPEYSHHFLQNPNDSGISGDVTADDGIWSQTSHRSFGYSGLDISNLIVRISVKDTLGNIRVVEKPLYVGIFTNGFD